MADHRLTLWPGSVPNDDTHLPVPFEHGKVLNKPVTPRGRTGVGDGATSTETRMDHIGIGTSRRPPYDVSNATKRKRPLREDPGHSLLDSGPRDGDETVASQKPRIERRNLISNSSAYHEFMELDQAGPAVIGCENTRECNLVAIKRLKGVNKALKPRIQPFTSNQVVELKDMFFDDDDLVIVYEQMETSLRAVTGILPGTFRDFQIAAICKELVGGLAYIHSELSLYHGDLNCGTILLNRDGMVKIANIGESFAWNKQITANNKRKDVQSIGFVMMELMEPVTYMENRQSTKLQDPEKWKDGTGIKDFLRATRHKSLEILENHEFLPKEPIAKSLRAHVFCAPWALDIKWRILSLP